MNRPVALVTGFEPYGGRGLNPAAEVVARVDGIEINGARVVGRKFPVSFVSLRQSIRQTLAEVTPAVVISLGLWPGEAMIRLERIGTNVADFEIPDNEGMVLADKELEAADDAGRFATLPLSRIRDALIEAGIPARLSSTAGTFLCNATLYTFLGAIEESGKSVRCGFIHLPYLPEQVAGLIAETRAERSIELHQRADIASMSLETMVEAVHVALSVSLENGADG
ncbi:MAG: pyroglutamyl-peptidase I [Alphaproteobacteria bacterium]